MCMCYRVEAKCAWIFFFFFLDKAEGFKNSLFFSFWFGKIVYIFLSLGS
jgi:hypothetical protein